MGKWKNRIEKLKKGALRELIREFRWIGRYGLRYKGDVAWYVFLGLLGTFMSLGASVVSKNILDAVTGYRTTALVPAAVFYAGMQLARIGISAWASRISAKTEIRVDQEIRAEVYDKIMRSDWQALSKYHSGDLLNRVDNDVASISSCILGWIPDGITKSAQFLGSLGIILYYDPSLALLALASAPITLLVSRSVMGRIRKYNLEMREASSKVMMFNQESFRNVQTIKSFNLGETYGKKLRQVQADYRDLRLDYNKYSIAASSILSLAGTVVSVACFGWGVYRLWGGHITFGIMTLFLQMAGYLASSFNGLVQLVPGAISAATAAKRIMAITEIEEEDLSGAEEADKLLRENLERGIQVQTEKVEFSYEGAGPVLHEAEILAKPGEIVALVGPSGEGKTTMLRLLLGIVRPRSGTVRITGVKTGQEMTACASTRRLFSYVPQTHIMFDGTVGDNLKMMAPKATEEELWNALEMACAADFIRKLPKGLDTPLIEDGGGLSQGQMQRLSIARAILADAPVLLLDEATSALDVATERKVLRNVLASGSNKTVIVTTHRPSVLGVCDRVYEISGQRVRALSAEEVEKKIADF